MSLDGSDSPPSGPLERLGLRRAGAVRWVLIGCAAVALTRPLVGGSLPLDLHVYIAGGHAVLHGHDVYGPGVQVRGYGFTYPPFAALAFAPFATVPVWSVELFTAVVFFAALAAALEACVPGLLGEIGASWSRFGLLALVLLGQPTWATLRDGQVNMLLLALVLWDLRPGRTARSRGALVGVCAGVKLTPAIFVCYLLVRRQWAAAGNAVAAFVATVAFTWAVAPADSREFWLHNLFGTSRVGDTQRVSNQSLLGLLLRATSDDGVAWTVWAGATALVLSAALCVAHRLAGQGQEILALAVMGIGGCLISPVSWTHHWVWFIPLLCGLARWPNWPGRWRYAAVGAVSAVFILGCHKPLIEAAYGTEFGRVVLSNLFVLTGLATVAALFVMVRTRPEPIGGAELPRAVS